MSPDEERLRQRFAELKKHDEQAAPTFEKLRSAARPARSLWRVVVPVMGLATAAMVVLWCGAQTMSSSAAPQAVAPAVAPAGAGRPSAAGGGAGAAMGGEGVAAFDPVPLDFLLETSGATGAARTSGLDSNPLAGW
jgi:hypothetical protein